MPDFMNPSTANPAFGGGWDPASIAGFGVSPAQIQSNVPGLMSGGPSFDDPGNWFQRAGIGMNMPTFNLALGGLQTLGGLWGAMQAASIAKKQLGFTTAVTNANLQNQTKSYNTALSDRITSRGVAEGLSPAAVQDYLAKNSLSTPRIG